jgi:hypothetical protein
VLVEVLKYFIGVDIQHVLNLHGQTSSISYFERCFTLSTSCQGKHLLKYKLKICNI